ncbi:unnamed protein product, partial [Oppiella nova]
MCLTNDTRIRINITKPDGYDPAIFELYLRDLLAKGHHNKTSDLNTPGPQLPGYSPMPHNKSDYNMGDYVGMNHDYANGSYEVRQKIFNQHKTYSLGLIYFMQNDPRMPKVTKSHMVGW